MRPEQFNFVKSLKNINLRAILRNVLKEEESDILDLQKEQMSAGLADKGDEIQPGYTKKTREIKQKKGQPSDRVTLKDTGAFYRDQYVKYSVEHFEITTRNRKRLKLIDKYHGNRGGDIFGLSEESRMILVRSILPIIQRLYRERALRDIRK